MQELLELRGLFKGGPFMRKYGRHFQERNVNKLTQLSSSGLEGMRDGDGGVGVWHTHAKTSSVTSSLSVHLAANEASSGRLSESPPDNEAAEVELWFGRRIKLEANEGADIFRRWNF